MAGGPAETDGANGARVDLGRLAEHDPLALEIKRRIVAHPPGSLGQRALDRMWGTIVVVRRDAQAVGARLRELTLRFDYGQLVVHDGRVGRPDISLWGTDAQLLSLGDVTGGGRADRDGEAEWPAPRRWWAIGRIISRVSDAPSETSRLQIFGGLAHPRLLYRLALVLAAPADLTGAAPGDRS